MSLLKVVGEAPKVIEFTSEKSKTKVKAKEKSKESTEDDEVGQYRKFVSGTDYDIRRVEDGGTIYIRTESNKGEVCWQKADKDIVKKHLLIQHGLNDMADQGFASEADKAIYDALKNFRVDFVGNYSGYLQPGEYQIKGETLLVPRGATLIEPVQGDCEFTWSLIHAAYPIKDQADVVLSWCKWAIEGLRKDAIGTWRHGQALIMVGDSGDGKTAFQRALITPMLANRDCDPAPFFSGTTTFNGQLGEAEHWLMSDPGGVKPAERLAFISKIKKACADVGMNIHPKGKQALDLLTFRRLTATLNQDEQALALLPEMAESSLDKIIIVNFCNAGKYGPDGLRYSDWFNKLQAELPAFIWRLLNEYEIPAHLRHTRYGVVYHNPELEPKFKASTEDEIDAEQKEIIYKAIFEQPEDSRNDGDTDPTLKAVMKKSARARRDEERREKRKRAKAQTYETTVQTPTPKPAEEKLTSGGVYDLIYAVYSPVKDRAKRYDALSSPKNIGNFLSRLFGDTKDDEWVECNRCDFSRKTYGQNSSKRSIYSFIKVDRDDDELVKEQDNEPEGEQNEEKK
jgi:hypothetical protein